MCPSGTNPDETQLPTKVVGVWSIVKRLFIFAKGRSLEGAIKENLLLKGNLSSYNEDLCCQVARVSFTYLQRKEE